MDGTRAGGSPPILSSLPMSVCSVSLAVWSALLLLFLPAPAIGQIKPIQLEGFIVTGAPVPRTIGSVASNVTVLDGEGLRRRGILRVADALAEVPGLVVVQNGSLGSVTSTFFRGAESDHVKVLVDGVEMNQAGGVFDLAGLLVSDVERIEVLRGPASALYGSDAMAGVIHVVTRRGDGPRRVSISAAGGSFGKRIWGADLHGGLGEGGYAVSLSRVTSDGILAFNNGFENTALSAKGFTTLDQGTRLEVSGRYSDRTYHFPTDGSGNVVDQNAFSFGKEWSLAAEGSRMVLGWLEATATLRTYAWDGGANDRPDDPGDTLGYYGYTSEDSFTRTSGEFRGSLVPWVGSVLSAGAEIEREDQRSTSESFSQFGPTQGESEFNRWNRGYYAHLVSDEAHWGGNLGVRLDDSDQYGRFFTYQAGISYSTPRSGTRFRASMGRGLKEPAFLETSSTGFTVGNPDLKPERSFVWEVGIEQAMGASGAAVSLTWFRQSLKDLIQYTFTSPEAGGPNFFNVAEARTQGVEFSLSAPLGPVTLTGAYTFLDSEVLDSGFDEGDGAVFVDGSPLIRRPRHQGTVRARYSFRSLAINGAMRWIGSRSDRDFSAWPYAPVDLGSYALFEVSGELMISPAAGGRPGVNLQFRGENLLDSEYQEIFGFRPPGRSFQVGFQMTFGESGS